MVWPSKQLTYIGCRTPEKQFLYSQLTVFLARRIKVAVGYSSSQYGQKY